jgi:hypothetical protein
MGLWISFFYIPGTDGSSSLNLFKIHTDWGGEGGSITRIKYPPHTGASLPKPHIPNQNWYELYELPIFNCVSGLCTTFCDYYMGKKAPHWHWVVPHAAFEPRAIFWTLREAKGIQNSVRKWRCDDHKGSVFDLTWWFSIVVKSRKMGSFAQHHITVDQSLLWEMHCSLSRCRDGSLL